MSMIECKFCNRKYKRESKMEEHMEKNHPYASIGSNNKCLTMEQREYLISQLEHYLTVVENPPVSIEIKDAVELYMKDPTNEDAKFISISHLLLPQSSKQYDKKELKRITKNHLEFCRRVKESGLINKIKASASCIEAMIDEFGRFLNLGCHWSGDNFCPSLIIDFIWHASMLNPEEYGKLTSLPHCLEANEDAEIQQKRYQIFLKQFEHEHNQSPLSIADLDNEHLSLAGNLQHEPLSMHLPPISLVGNLQHEHKDDAFQVLKTKYAKLKAEQKEKDESKALKEEKERENANKRYDEYMKDQMEKFKRGELVTPSGWRSPWDDGKC